MLSLVSSSSKSMWSFRKLEMLSGVISMGCGVLGYSDLGWCNAGAEGLFLSKHRVLRCEVLLLDLCTTGYLSRGVLPKSHHLLLWRIQQFCVISLGDRRSIWCLYVWLHGIQSMLRLWCVLEDRLVVFCGLSCFVQESRWVLLPPGCNWCLSCVSRMFEESLTYVKAYWTLRRDVRKGEICSSDKVTRVVIPLVT